MMKYVIHMIADYLSPKSVVILTFNLIKKFLKLILAQFVYILYTVDREFFIVNEIIFSSPSLVSGVLSDSFLDEG